MNMNWINVKDKLPNHQQIVLCYAKTKSGKYGFGIATFIDCIKMNQELMNTPYSYECIDIIKHPYYFVSQEIKGFTFNNVTYWMIIHPPYIIKNPYL